ncbi:uncharacterized protein LOC111365962 [Olea europaea var. sylvestris]|uniref:uncharacterized protein LOC111365962 n=1 Tax=Olea europaea var. sylvestris TaxID=158386 RepID=UPI000C1D0425|nr:uncharacterized protein LOC111365962 [Olea europaea var. sylvestris]
MLYSAYLDDSRGNVYGRDMLKSLMDPTKDLNITHIELELKLLRQRMNEDCTLVNKKYAILDFQFEEECCQQMRWHMEYNQTSESDGTRLQDYVNGTLPIAGRSWMGCKYLLIPSAYPGNECYLFLVNIRE